MNNTNLPSVSETSVKGEHQVTLSLSILQAVEPSEKDLPYRESVRDGEKKRIYESPISNHHFHLEYQLLPGKNAQVFKTDVMTFGNVVAKVFTDKDNRVVQCWTEEEREEAEGDTKLNHFGWRHKHTFKVNKEQLLELYDHVLEIRVWNTKSKLSARAKYDRPKAFRIPVRTASTKLKGELIADPDIKDVPGIVKRQSKFAVVSHDNVRRVRTNRPTNSPGLTYSSPLAQTTSETVQINIQPDESIGSAISPRRSAATADGQLQTMDKAVSDSCRALTEDGEMSESVSGISSNQLVPTSSSIAQSVSLESADTQSSRQLQVLAAASRKRQKRIEAEAAEEARIEREGIAVLRINLRELFGKQGTTEAWLNYPVKDLKIFEVRASVSDTFLTKQLSKELNPMMITVVKATGLPSTPLTHKQLQERCDASFARYQFYDQPPYHTGGVPQAAEAVWNDTHVMLLGTIDPQLLVEYLRGPPLLVELHDRARRHEDCTLPALFGAETRDDVLGTHAFTAGVSHSSPAAALHRDRPWSPYGLARLDLSGLLQGQRMLEFNIPVTNGPRCSPNQHHASINNLLPPGDYISSQCQLKVLVEVTHPLCSNSVPAVVNCTKITPEHVALDLTKRTDKSTPEHLSTDRRTDRGRGIANRKSKVIEKQSSKVTTEKTTPEHTLFKPDLCPFNRVIFNVSSTGKGIVEQLISAVNCINAIALNLEELSDNVLPAALSTYKLTKEQMSSGDCDVITGFQLEDGERHVIVLEGLKCRGLKRIWEQSPHHNTADEDIMKVHYNSEFEFSQRLYASLDVDVPRVQLYRPLSSLTRHSLLYIKNAIPDKCFRALMTLTELTCVSEMSDVTRNNLFPSAEEVTALSLQFALPATADLSNNGNAPVDPDREPDNATHPSSSSPREWIPLELTNPQYERHLVERHNLPAPDYIAANKHHVQTLSEAAGSRKKLPHHRRSSRQRSMSEATPVHNYSSQTYNSVTLATVRLRERLSVVDPQHRYTYSQHYHSRTLVPVNIEAEKKQQISDATGRWRTSEGFVYPGVASARSSNVHPRMLHPSTLESLVEPFKDNQLHANTLKPTVERLHFSWENRSRDFELWQRPPALFGPPLVGQVHLAGESRAREVQERLDIEQEQWSSKLIVSNPRMQSYRLGLRTELTDSGPKASTQLDKLRGLLKDSPQKLSLKQAGLTVHDLPTLDVIHNARLNHSNGDETNELRKRGCVPGIEPRRSLKLDSNVVPLSKTPAKSSKGVLEHPQDFRLYYHIPTLPAGAMAVTEGD